MSDAKWISGWTSGKWVAFHDTRADEWSVRIKTHDHWGIYTLIAELGGNYGQAEANAHLIASAPAMAEALKPFLTDYYGEDLILDEDIPDEAYVDITVKAKVIRAVRAALSRESDRNPQGGDLLGSVEDESAFCEAFDEANSPKILAHGGKE